MSVTRKKLGACVAALAVSFTLASQATATAAPITSPSTAGTAEVPELAASAQHLGRKINLWVTRDLTWHGHLEYGAEGDRVWAENWWGNVVGSAVVPANKFSVDTSSWRSHGTYRVCGKANVGTVTFCSPYATRG